MVDKVDKMRTHGRLNILRDLDSVTALSRPTQGRVRNAFEYMMNTKDKLHYRRAEFSTAASKQIRIKKQ